MHASTVNGPFPARGGGGPVTTRSSSQHHGSGAIRAPHHEDGRVVSALSSLPRNRPIERGGTGVARGCESGEAPAHLRRESKGRFAVIVAQDGLVENVGDIRTVAHAEVRVIRGVSHRLETGRVESEEVGGVVGLLRDLARVRLRAGQAM